MLSFCTSTGILPTACTPSVWKKTPFSLAILPISAIGLDHADFVVGVHDGDQDRFRRDGAAQVVEIDAAVLVHGQVGDFVAVLFQALAGVEHGLVLGHLRDDVVALLAVHLRDALDRQVVRFGGAAGEDDLLRRGVDQAGDLRARVFHRFFGRPAEGVVAAGGVAELLVKYGSIASTTRGSTGVVA